MNTMESLGNIFARSDCYSEPLLINSDRILDIDIYSYGNVRIGKGIIRNSNLVVLLYYKDETLYVHPLVGQSLQFLVDDQVFLLKQLHDIDVKVERNVDIYNLLNLPSIKDLNEYSQQKSREQLELFRSQSSSESIQSNSV